MITRLRRKFILINMTLVSLVLLIVFAALFISNYQRLQSESREALYRAMEQRMDMPQPKPEIGRIPPGRKPFPTTPVFSVVLDENKNIIYTTQQNVSISEDDVQTAVKQALNARFPEGILRDLNLRFLRTDFIEGTKIALPTGVMKSTPCRAFF